MSKYKLALFLAVSGLAILACSLTGAGVSPSMDQSLEGTLVAQTLEAQLTQIAASASETPIFVPPTATANVFVPTSTPNPTSTPRPTATRTSVPTATSVPCNLVGFISDVTIPDGSLVVAGAEFSKVWRLKNIGSCAWTAHYELVYFSGDKLGGASVTEFNTRVEPGEMIDVGVDLKAPASTGKKLGYWMLRTNDGKMFGMGPGADQPFWVEIKVISPTSSGYSFAEHICDARWEEANSPLPCQGVVGPEDNVVQLRRSIQMESGVTEDELALWINLGHNGVVKGMYPAQVVQSGDHFVTEIGCIKDSKQCHARFTLSYKEVGTGTIVDLHTWEEDYDHDTRVISFDLSSLAGKNVKFILKVVSMTSNADTQVFWFVPHIQNP